MLDVSLSSINNRHVVTGMKTWNRSTNVWDTRLLTDTTSDIIIVTSDYLGSDKDGYIFTENVDTTFGTTILGAYGEPDISYAINIYSVDGSNNQALAIPIVSAKLLANALPEYLAKNHATFGTGYSVGVGDEPPNPTGSGTYIPITII